jgi:hypothetical protein
MGNEHKKPVGAPAGVDGQSHLLRGDGVGRRCRPGRDGTVGSVEHGDLDVVVASRPRNGSGRVCVINWSITRSVVVQDRRVNGQTEGRVTDRVEV